MISDTPKSPRFDSLKAFTLVEMIIVIMVVAVLTTLALPKMRGSVEYSKSMEAFIQIGSIRSSLDRCLLIAGGSSYENCGFSQLDINDPGEDLKAHFSYTLSNLGENSYTITALRNTNNNGDGTSTIVIERNSTDIKRSGTGIFEKIK